MILNLTVNIGRCKMKCEKNESYKWSKVLHKQNLNFPAPPQKWDYSAPSVKMIKTPDSNNSLQVIISHRKQQDAEDQRLIV